MDERTKVRDQFLLVYLDGQWFRVKQTGADVIGTNTGFSVAFSIVVTYVKKTSQLNICLKIGISALV